SDGEGKKATAKIKNSILGQSGSTAITNFASATNGGMDPDNSGSNNLMSNPGTFPAGGVIVANPLLGLLASNGGPTQTMALLAGSPAIDAGDPAFNPADPDGNPSTNDAIPYDQRGAGFDRVRDGDGAGGARVDIGAFELQSSGPVLPGDYN